MNLSQWMSLGVGAKRERDISSFLSWRMSPTRAIAPRTLRVQEWPCGGGTRRIKGNQGCRIDLDEQKQEKIKKTADDQI